MKSHAKVLRRIASAAIATVAALGLAVACTNADDHLGAGFIPGGEGHLGLRIDTLGLAGGELLSTYQVYYDSIGLASSQRHQRGAMNLNVAYIGSAADPQFGRTKTASVFTGLPSTPTLNNYYKNRRNSIDSAKIILNMKYVSGNADVRQTFNIYRLRDTLAYAPDTLYYQSFPYENYMDSDPLFSFEYSGTPNDIEVIALDIHPAGRTFLDELAVADTTLFYTDKAYEFLRRFKGFVIAQDKSTPEGAAIYANYLPNSYINLYFQRQRDQWEIDLDKNDKSKEHTAIMQLYLSDAKGMKNTSVASIRHDFTGTDYEPLQRGERVATGAGAFVRGLGGMATEVVFPDEFFGALEKAKPDERWNIFINQARMFVWLDADTPEEFDAAFQKLGSYSDYGRLSVIPDYYISDTNTSGMTIPYDGSLNRDFDKGYYTMDITSFLQHALLDTSGKYRKLTLAPTYDPYEPFSQSNSTLMTAVSGKPIAVRVTYTLIGPDGK